MQDTLQMAPAEDQHVVEALPSYSAHPSLRERVRPRCPDGGLHDAEALGPKDLVERSGELGVSIPEQEVPVLQLLRNRQVPSLLSDPGGVGPARRSDDVNIDTAGLREPSAQPSLVRR
jgi:hypothetical protein